MNLKRIISIVLVCLLAASSMTAKGRKNKAPVRVTCIGASITEGATTTDPANDSYPAQLGRMLGDRYVVSNFGVSGTTMLKKGDSPYWDTEAYKKALASEPEIVFIDLGGNDSKAVNRRHMDEFVKDACEMIISHIEKMSVNMQIPTRLECVLEDDIPYMACLADKEANPLYPVPKLWDATELRELYYLV
jgi:lysophospholipase L1-like esterase